MNLITRTVSAIAKQASYGIAFTATLLASTSAFALTPFQAATLAYRGQLKGIPGYQSLQANIRSGRITGEDILEAAGLDVNNSDAHFVETILRDNGSMN